MINMSCKKLTGLLAGHVYVVTALANEFESPMHWTLQCETIKDQKLNVSEDDLADKARLHAAD